MNLSAVDDLINEASNIVETPSTPYAKDRLKAIQEYRRNEAKSAEPKSRNSDSMLSRVYSTFDEVSEFKAAFTSMKGIEFQDQEVMNKVQQELFEAEISPQTLQEWASEHKFDLPAAK